MSRTQTPGRAVIRTWILAAPPSTGASGAGAATIMTAGTSRGTILTNGKAQVTYAGHPLYYFIASTKPGQVNGQGVNAFGAHWDAIRPSGAQAG